MSTPTQLLLLCVLADNALGFMSIARPRSHVDVRVTAFPMSIVARPSADGVSEFSEKAAIAAAAKVTSVPLVLPDALADGPVESSFISTDVEPQPGVPPIVMLHSFDSSCLEWRRVLPLLAAEGLEAYALDILGWGFSETSNARGVSVEAKRAHLLAFCQQHLDGRPALLVGSSLGAAAIIDLGDCGGHQTLIYLVPSLTFERISSPAYIVASSPSAAEGVVLLDPQALIDGTPPVPAFAARGGVRLLKSWPLRAFGQKLAYEDLERCDTDDAIRIGRVHCERAGWEDDAVSWLLGGGYSVSKLLPRLRDTRCLILWGRQDRVLPPADNVPKFVSLLPTADFRWVESCGHVPHLE